MQINDNDDDAGDDDDTDEYNHESMFLGMWIGYTCGMFMETIVGCIILVTTDWENQVQRVSRSLLFRLISRDKRLLDTYLVYKSVSL